MRRHVTYGTVTEMGTADGTATVVGTADGVAEGVAALFACHPCGRSMPMYHLLLHDCARWLKIFVDDWG